MPLLRKVKRFVRPLSDQSGMRYEIAIVLLLSDAAQNYARRIQLDLLKKYHIKHGISARPHVTLKLGFRTFDIDLIEEYFDQLIHKLNPVEISINKFGFFEEGIVFLDVEQSAPLENMRQRIISDLKSKFSILPHPIEGDAYRFHATVAHGLSKRDFDQAREMLQNERVDFKFTATTCALFFCIDGQWITYKQATLLERNAPPCSPQNARDGLNNALPRGRTT